MLEAAIRTVPRISLAKDSTACTASVRRARIFSAYSYSSLPASERKTSFVVRTSSWTRSFRSREATWALMVGWVRYSAWAAREKLPFLTT